MTSAYPACKFAAETYLLKLQCLQNKALHTTGNFPKHRLICKLHVPFKIPYVMTLQNYAVSRSKSSKMKKMHMFAIQGMVKPCTESITGLNLVAVRFTIVQVTKLSL